MKEKEMEENVPHMGEVRYAYKVSVINRMEKTTWIRKAQTGR
jgi:hypothetical protein